jgi:hypothetical protein
MALSYNPWSAASWNITEQGKVISRYGLDAAERVAALAGARVGDTRPAITPFPSQKTYVIRGKPGPAGPAGPAGAVIPIVIDGD